MKKLIIFLLAVSACLPISADDEGNISAIRAYYGETMTRIRNGVLYRREIRLEHPVIPGVGPTSSKVRIHYDLPEGRDGAREYRVIRVENLYQHTVKAYFEEYLFYPDGDLAFYYGRQGTGDIMSEEVDWSYEERFYYRKGKPIRVIYDRRVIDAPSGDDVKKAAARNRHARALNATHSRIGFHPPLLFNEE